MEGAQAECLAEQARDTEGHVSLSADHMTVTIWGHVLADVANGASGACQIVLPPFCKVTLAASQTWGSWCQLIVQVLLDDDSLFYDYRYGLFADQEH